MEKPIHLDGTTLEGGGQLFRLALSLSAITGKPVHLTDIRGKRGGRSKNGQDGGIKPAHFAGADWLARATAANTEGLEVKSKELVFRPLVPTRAAASDKSSRHPEVRLSNGITSNQLPNVWEDVYESGKLIRRETVISMKTPGSVFLVLQAILPYALFSSVGSKNSPDPSQVEPVLLRFKISGGTNVWHSLSYEYADQVLFPMLEQKLGLGPFTVELQRRGWSTGSNTIGSIQVDVFPVRTGQTLPSFSYTDRGEIVKLRVSILAPDQKWRGGIRGLVTKQILRRWPEVEILFPVDELSGHKKRIYLLLVAESSNGYRLGRDWLYDEKVNEEKPDKTIEKIVSKVVRDLEMEVDHGGCVDEWLQDQLVVFQALAEGMPIVDGRDPSLHTRTAQWVAEEILAVAFDKRGNCEGKGLVAGLNPRLCEDITSVVESMEQLRV